MKNNIEGLKDRIWITERCHMKAEKRKRFFENYFHITLALYAIASIAMSLFDKDEVYALGDGVITFTSVCTLSLSLLVFGFKFGETAAQHRDCYLGLQRLRLHPAQSENELNEKYIDTLSYYPNHSTNDYLAVVITNILFEKQSLNDSTGDPIRLSAATRVGYGVSWLALRLAGFAFFVVPIWLILYSSGFWGILERCAVAS